MLGMGSYSFRWSIGHKGLVPENPMTHADLLDIAADLDLGLVQYADNIPFDDVSQEELIALRKKADDLGIELEIGTQSFNAQQVTKYIGIAQVLRAKILRVALDGPDAEVPIPELADEFVALLPLAESAGVRIAIENHFNYPAPRLVKLLEEINSPTVGVCLDVANSICAGEWPMETVGTLAAHTINLHLKDYDIVPDPYGVGFRIQGTPLGQGRTDCNAVMAAMPKGRDINVIMEHWLPQEDDMATARAKELEWLTTSVTFARETLGL